MSQPVDMAQHGVLPTAQTWLARPSPGRYLSPGKEETTNQQIDTTESRMNLTLPKRRKGSTVFGPKWLNFGGRPGRPTILRWPNVNPNLLKMDSLMDKDFIDGVFSLVLCYMCVLYTTAFHASSINIGIVGFWVVVKSDQTRSSLIRNPQEDMGI